MQNKIDRDDSERTEIRAAIVALTAHGNATREMAQEAMRTGQASTSIREAVVGLACLVIGLAPTLRRWH